MCLYSQSIRGSQGTWFWKHEVREGNYTWDFHSHPVAPDTELPKRDGSLLVYFESTVLSSPLTPPPPPASVDRTPSNSHRRNATANPIAPESAPIAAFSTAPDEDSTELLVVPVADPV